MKLLHIDASVLGDNSVSRHLTAAVVAQFKQQIDGLQVDYRDLDANPVPHLRSGSLAKTDAAEAADAEQVLEQFLAADIVVIGAPMYNFSVPSTLKAWIDRVAVAGRTFKYTENGPVGLAGGKRVIVVSSRGGIYTDSPADFQEPFLRQT
ncbi:FMN-dependent NADH-azoreductase, partial [Stenotrophomonas sp. HMWF022]